MSLRCPRVDDFIAGSSPWISLAQICSVNGTSHWPVCWGFILLDPSRSTHLLDLYMEMRAIQFSNEMGHSKNCNLSRRCHDDTWHHITPYNTITFGGTRFAKLNLTLLPLPPERHWSRRLRSQGHRLKVPEPSEDWWKTGWNFQLCNHLYRMDRYVGFPKVVTFPKAFVLWTMDELF